MSESDIFWETLEFKFVRGNDYIPSVMFSCVCVNSLTVYTNTRKYNPKVRFYSLIAHKT